MDHDRKMTRVLVSSAWLTYISAFYENIFVPILHSPFRDVPILELVGLARSPPQPSADQLSHYSSLIYTFSP